MPIDAASILVVEDDPATRALLSDKLTLQRLKAVPAINGRQAQERLQKEPVDLILTSDYLAQFARGFEYSPGEYRA